MFLSNKKRLYVLENPIPNVFTEDAKEEVRNEYQRHVDNDKHAACVMLVSMSPKLQRQHENINAHIININVHTIIMHLK